MFRRRKQEDAAAEPAVEAAPAVEEAPAGVPSPQGPWDEADAPDDGRNRLDLGGLRVPVPPDVEVRVDVSPEGQVVAATLVQGQSSMQVNAFAAPRREGIWDEVRAEIREALVSTGGNAVDVQGTFGTELHAAVPTEVAGQGRVLAPARFVGVDGPRWFVRALLTGPGAVEPAQAEPLLTALRDTVVVRGTEAMAVRDPLPLHLPREVAEQAAAAQAAPPAADDEPSLTMPERGPEITEVR